MTDDLRARLHAALTAPHALDALERLVVEVTADLRAENERLRGDVKHWQQKWKRRGSALGARVETAEGLTEWLWDQSGSLVEMVASGLASAQAAEARVAALETTLANVRSLALDWPCSDETCDGDCTGCAYGRDLRSALDADGADATATDGSGR